MTPPPPPPPIQRLQCSLTRLVGSAYINSNIEIPTCPSLTSDCSNSSDITTKTFFRGNVNTWTNTHTCTFAPKAAHSSRVSGESQAVVGGAVKEAQFALLLTAVCDNNKAMNTSQAPVLNTNAPYKYCKPFFFFVFIKLTNFIFSSNNI